MKIFPKFDFSCPKSDGVNSGICHQPLKTSRGGWHRVRILAWCFLRYSTPDLCCAVGGTARISISVSIMPQIPLNTRSWVVGGSARNSCVMLPTWFYSRILLRCGWRRAKILAPCYQKEDSWVVGGKFLHILMKILVCQNLTIEIRPKGT